MHSMSEQILSFFLLLKYSYNFTFHQKKAYLTFLTLFSSLSLLILSLSTPSDKNQEYMFYTTVCLFFSKEKVAFPQTTDVPPKMTPRVKGAVALLPHFQRLSLFANANHSFSSLQTFFVWSFISGVTCTWRMPQKLCILIILLALFFFLRVVKSEKLQPEIILKGRMLNHFWLHIFLHSLENYGNK